jgi:amino acid adenylation domain-containing protein
VVAILAVLKAGAAFMPLDPDSPAVHLAGIVRSAGSPLVLASTDALPALAACDVRTLVADEAGATPGDEHDDCPATVVRAGNLAYVMHTSGSTGAPKRVAVEHRHIAQYTRAFLARACLQRGASFALVQPLTVDASLTFVFPPLATGGCIHVMELPDALDPAAMRSYLDGHAIDYLKLAPSHLAALEAGQQRRLMPRKALIVGGEPARLDILASHREQNPALRVISQYGPTETTVGGLVYELRREELESGAICPLGRPLDGVSAHVLGGELDRVPPGEVGMLYIGGPGVSRGYLGDPALTAASFVPNPSGSPGSRIYRTGDLARRRPDGVVEFAGRGDDQIKVRGFRVEPGEVRAHLAALPSVVDAVVTVRRPTPEAPELVAHVLTEPGSGLTHRQVMEQLRGRVPERLVPSHLVLVDHLPLTPHGKVDLAALAAIDGGAVRHRPAPAGQARPAETVLVELWRELLHVDNVGPDDDFFELGGHSLLATQLVARLHAAAGVELPLRVFFTAPTLAAMSDAVDRLLLLGTGTSDRRQPCPEP